MNVRPLAANFSFTPAWMASSLTAVEGAMSISVMSCTPPEMITCRMASSSPMLRKARLTLGGTEMVSSSSSSTRPLPSSFHVTSKRPLSTVKVS